MVRIDPATGSPATGHQQADRLVAYGQRNPWRLTFRPGTNELWSGDVGGSTWEEINRIPDVAQSPRRSTAAGPATRATTGGSLGQPGWDALDKPICENLYAQGTAAVTRRRTSAYQTRGAVLTPGRGLRDSCRKNPICRLAPCAKR